MPIYCIIPAKPYAESKTRLAPVLSPEERAALSRRLLLRTVRLARTVVGAVIVVSRDRGLLEEAQAEGAWGLVEEVPGLNPALAQAARFAGEKGAGGILVLPADLPLLTAHDLEAILAYVAHGHTPFSLVGRRAGDEGRSAVVVAPCRHGTGTNALLVHPLDLIPFAFGLDSFAAHCAAARAAGLEPVIYRSHTIALDLDTPEDFEIEGWR